MRLRDTSRWASAVSRPICAGRVPEMPESATLMLTTLPPLQITPAHPVVQGSVVADQLVGRFASEASHGPSWAAAAVGGGGEGEIGRAHV